MKDSGGIKNIKTELNQEGINHSAATGLVLEPWVQVGAASVESGFPARDVHNNNAFSSLCSKLGSSIYTPEHEHRRRYPKVTGIRPADILTY
jgi:hypothetical protein